MVVRWRAEPAALQPLSQEVCFGGVAAERMVALFNTSASWLRVQPASPPAAGPFRWPWAPVLLPPGHQLSLPIAFNPEDPADRQSPVSSLHIPQPF